MKKRYRRLGASLAAVTFSTALVVAPVADGEVPSDCATEREGEAPATTWGGSILWAVNVYGDQSTFGSASVPINTVKLTVRGATQGEFPAHATYGVRTNVNAEYVDAPGYGGVDADGNPTLYVFIPETYTTDIQTLQIQFDDPGQELPKGRTGTSATLYTAPASQVSLKTFDEFGEPAQLIPASIAFEEFTFPASRHDNAGTIYFDHLPACKPVTVKFDTPKFSKYLAPVSVSSDGLSPANTTDLGTHTIRFERGEFTASILGTDGQPIAGQSVRVEGPGGIQTLTTNDAGRFDLTEAQPGAYTLSAESNGSTLQKTLFVKPGESRSVSARFAAAPVSGTQAITTVTSTVAAETTVTPAPVTVQSMATVTETVLSTTTTSRTVPATVHTGEPVTVTSTAHVAITSTAPRPVVTRTASATTTTEKVVVDPNGRVVLTALAVVATLGGAVAAVLGSIPGLDVQQLAARIEGGK